MRRRGVDAPGIVAGAYECVTCRTAVGGDAWAVALMKADHDRSCATPMKPAVVGSRGPSPLMARIHRLRAVLGRKEA